MGVDCGCEGRGTEPSDDFEVTEVSDDWPAPAPASSAAPAPSSNSNETDDSTVREGGAAAEDGVEGSAPELRAASDVGDPASGEPAAGEELSDPTADFRKRARAAVQTKMEQLEERDSAAAAGGNSNSKPSQSRSFTCAYKIEAGWHPTVAIYLLNLEANCGVNQTTETVWNDIDTPNHYDVTTSVELPKVVSWLVKVSACGFGVRILNIKY